MKGLKIINKICAAVTAVVLSLMVMPLANTVTANTLAPSADMITVSGLVNNVSKGGGMTIKLKFSSNAGIKSLTAPSNGSAMWCEGFIANKNMEVDSVNKIVTIRLGSIVSTSTSQTKKIHIAGGLGIDNNNLLSNPIDLTFNMGSQAPKVTVSGPNVSSIYVGGSVKYTLNYSDDIGTPRIDPKGFIKLNGFTGNINVSVSGNVATVTINDIVGSVGGEKNITILEGSATDTDGNKSNSVTSGSFSIAQKPVTPTPDPKPEEKPDPKPEEKPNPEPEKPSKPGQVTNPSTGKF